MTWEERAAHAVARYEGGEGRDLDQRQLTQLANAAWAAGLSFLMAGERERSAEWLRHAAARYRESWEAGAPEGSWGRPIAAMKSLLLAGDDASAAAHWALEAGAAEAESPVGRYAGALALLVLGRDLEARVLGGTIREREDFPHDVADAVTEIAGGDRVGYLVAVEDILDSFERRTDFLEDVPVADTVMVLQILAAARDCDVELPQSKLLP